MLVRGNPDALKPPKNPMGFSGLGEIDPYAKRILDQFYTSVDRLNLYNLLRSRVETGAWADQRLTYGNLTVDEFVQWALGAGVLDQGDVNMALKNMAADTACDLDQFTREEALAQVESRFPGSINARTLALDFLNQGETCLATILDAARNVAAIEYANKAQVAGEMVAALEKEKTVYAVTPELVQNYEQHITEYQKALDVNTRALEDLPPELSVIPEPVSPMQSAGAPALVAKLPPNIGAMSTEGQAAVYNQLIADGHTDLEIRNAVEYVFGKQSNEDWGLLRVIASNLGAPASEGGVLKPPVGPALDPKVAAFTYNKLLAQGLSDAEIRKNAEETYGPQTDADWAALRSLAAEMRSIKPRQWRVDPNDPGWKEAAYIYNKQREQGISDAEIRKKAEAKEGPITDEDWAAFQAFATGKTVQPPAAGNLGPLLLAVATAYFLGA